MSITASPSQVDRFLELSADLVCVLDADDVVTHAGPSWRRALGSDPVGRPFGELTSTEFRSDVRAALASARGGENVRDVLVRHRRADGSPLDIRWSVGPDGSSDLLLAVGSDVTALRRFDKDRQVLATTWPRLASARTVPEMITRVREHAKALIGAKSATCLLDPGGVPETHRSVDRVSVPMLGHAGTVLGLLEVTEPIASHGTRPGFVARDQLLLEEFAGMAGLVLERLRAQARTAAALVRAEAITRLGAPALSGCSVEALIEQAIEQLGVVLGASRIAFVELMEGDRVLRVVASTPAAQRAVERHTSAGQPWGCLPGHTASDALGLLARQRGLTAGVKVGRSLWGYVVVAHADEDAGEADEIEVTQDELFVTQVAQIVGTALERARREEEIRFRAEHDPLTRLLNRSTLNSRVDQMAQTALERQHLAGLLVLDLDGFKDVNDSLGQSAGDAVLVQFADRLRRIMRKRDMISRLGGDEFACCLEGPLERDDLIDVAERIVESFSEPFSLDDLEVTLSASIGLVLTPLHGTDAATLLRRADVAMYRAKVRKDGWAIYDRRVDSAPSGRLSLISQLRNAMRRGELELAFQPIIDMRTGAVASAEALVRWRHPQRGLLAPAEFIPLASQTGLIGELTRVVLDQVAEPAARWCAAGLVSSVAINVDGGSLTDPARSRELMRRMVALREYVSVEVTESSVIEAGARLALEELAAEGVRCSIDDFGTGYSSMAMLKTLPVRAMKVDRSFISHLGDDRVDLAIVAAIATLAGALSVDLVAEGVEQESERAALLGLGITLGQGYLLAAPMSEEDFEAWVHARHQLTAV